MVKNCPCRVWGKDITERRSNEKQPRTVRYRGSVDWLSALWYVTSFDTKEWDLPHVIFSDRNEAVYPGRRS